MSILILEDRSKLPRIQFRQARRWNNKRKIKPEFQKAREDKREQKWARSKWLKISQL